MMTEFNIRRRLANDGMSPDEVDDVIDDLSNQANDEARDRSVEDHYKEQP